MTAKAFIAAVLITVCLCSCKGAGAYGSAEYSESMKQAESYETQSQSSNKTDNSVTEEGIFGYGAQKSASEPENTEENAIKQNKDNELNEENSGADSNSTEISDPSETSSEQKDKGNYVNTDGYGSIIP